MAEPEKFVVFQTGTPMPLRNLGVESYYSSTHAGLVPPGGARPALTGNRSYFVSTTGSDTYDGLTLATAFLTIQKAVDTAASFDTIIYDISIFVADGAYTGNVVLKTLVGAGSGFIIGNITTPATCLISTVGTAFAAANVIGRWNLSGFRITTTTSGFGLNIDNSYVGINGNMEFAACVNGHMVSTRFAVISITSPYTISASVNRHMNIQSLGLILYTPGSVTLVGTPNWSIGFVTCTAMALCTSNIVVFTGAATGKRFDATLNAVINTFGGGINYFPGDVAGTTATGAQYA